MAIDWHLIARYAAPIIAAFAGAALARWWERRPRLIGYLAHASAVTVNPPEGDPFPVHTHAVVVRNIGKKAATNVRLGHNVLYHFSVYPPVQYTGVDLPGGGREIVFPTLVPGEQITVAYLYYPPLIWSNLNTHIKSDEGFAKIEFALPTPLPSPAIGALKNGLMAAGTVMLVYAIVEIGRKLSHLLSGGPI